MQRQILIAKSGISNHAAADIRDDPCLSKFGALRRGMSALRKTICRTFVCVPYGTSEQNITARSRCLSRHLPYFQ